MDNRGYWHNMKDSEIEKLKYELAEGRDTARSNDRPRFVFSCDIGEGVEIVNEKREGMLCRFDAAEKNRVTLTPMNDGQPFAVFNFGDRVSVVRSNGDSIPAQIWDLRGGKIVLRTLPVA